MENLEARFAFAIDFADAPDSSAAIAHLDYTTLVSRGGPQHFIAGPRLGEHVDGDPIVVGWDAITQSEGWANRAYGYGDNIPAGPNFEHDEDGVFFPDFLLVSPTVATVGVVNLDVRYDVGPAYLDAWIDFDSDGDFTDAGEQIFTNLSVTAEKGDYQFPIPAGAAIGKTFSRFRISSQGGLASVGVLPGNVLPDGEVEDHAVILFGGPEAQEAIANQILAHRLQPGGIFKSLNDASFYYPSSLPSNDPRHLEWFTLDPYFTYFASRALLAAPDTPTLTTSLKLGVVEDQLDFWLTEVPPPAEGEPDDVPRPIRRVASLPSDQNATITRLYVDNNLKQISQVVCLAYQGGQCVWEINQNEIGADADDSSLAVMLSLAAAYYDTDGYDSAVLDRHRDMLDLLGNSLRHMIQANGLTFGFVNPLKSEAYPFQQAMDNFEVRQGLADYARLLREYYQDPVQAAVYQAAADQVAAGLENLFDAETQLYYRYAKFGSVLDQPQPELFDCLYPEAMLQAFPAITDAFPGDASRVRAPLDQIYATESGSPIDWYKQAISGSIAWAALRAGDRDQAKSAVMRLLPWALQNSRPQPLVTPCSPSGQQLPTVTTIADFAFVLQLLLPAANNDYAQTAVDTPRDIDVRANDYSLLSDSVDLVLEIAQNPTHGVVAIVDGDVRYTPNPGFVGRDAFVYRVTAAGGGSRKAVATVDVSAPVISDIPDIQLHPNAPTFTVPFLISDAETPAAALTLTISQNTSLFPTGGFTFSGSGSNRFLTLNPTDDVLGSATIVITVRDASGAEATESFTVTVLDLPTQYVRSVTPTSTGVQFKLSAAAQIADSLNLYNAVGQAFGPADVLVTNAAGEAIVGSLAVSTDQTVFHFVATAGVLPPGDYTLALRSAADGFRKLSSATETLDGDFNGVAGGDFVRSFTIAPPAANAVIVSLPHVVRGPDQWINLPATSSLGLPISVSDGSQVRRLRFELRYDPELMYITGVSASAGSTADLTLLAAGRILLTFDFSAPLGVGPQIAGYLQVLARAVDAADRYGDREVLDIAALDLRDAANQPLAALDQDSIHAISYFGDVGRNGRYDSFDVQQASRLAVRLDSGFSRHPLLDPALIGDFNGNGRIDSFDVQRLSRLALRLPAPEAPELPSPLPIVESTGRLAEEPPAETKPPAEKRPAHDSAPGLRADVDGDGAVTAADILWTIYALRRSANGAIPAEAAKVKVDVNGDLQLDAADVLFALYDFRRKDEFGDSLIGNAD